MRNHLIIILLSMLVIGTNTKKVSKKISAIDLVQGLQTIFITRFDFGIGSGNITLRYKYINILYIEKYSKQIHYSKT